MLWFPVLRWSLRYLRGSGRFQRPGHLLPGEGRPEGRVRRPVGPHRRADGERQGVGDAVPGWVRPPRRSFCDAAAAFGQKNLAWKIGEVKQFQVKGEIESLPAQQE